MDFPEVHFQWLRLCTFNTEDMDSISGRGTNIPHAVWSSQKKKKKRKECLFNFSEICINILVSNDTETRIKTNILLHNLSCFPLQK